MVDNIQAYSYNSRMKEVCRNPRALFGFLKVRIAEKEASKSIAQSLVNIDLIFRDLSSPTERASFMDIEARKEYQAERYLKLLEEGVLTREWRMYGEKHGEEILGYKQKSIFLFHGSIPRAAI
ncbi:MAG: hypothetical protein Q8P29_02930 [Candidatus Levybacteria bacterium]|nr:hypothetical protein [Candidatus Levybacteria bacterium]